MIRSERDLFQTLQAALGDGYALERELGRGGMGWADDADREFREVVALWQGADDRLLSVVQEARAGLARLRGTKG